MVYYRVLFVFLEQMISIFQTDRFCHLYSISKFHERCSLPPLLYKFLVHIVNREVSEQLFWNIFYLYSKACNICIKMIC